MVDEITRASLLYDFYGALLTEKQRQVMALYHEENLSLSEIGQEFGISRQAVHDDRALVEQQAASKGMITDVIEPAETRGALAMALRATLTKRETRLPKKHGNIPM